MQCCGPDRLLDDAPQVPSSVLLLVTGAKGESTPASAIKALTIDGSCSVAILKIYSGLGALGSTDHVLRM